MRIYVERVVSPIKMGFSSSSPHVRLAAHGRTEQIADLNLERTIAKFLAPFERTGTLMQEVVGIGLEVDDGSDPGISVVLRP